MRCVITGDVLRPGQDQNILRLYAYVAPFVADAFGEWPELRIGEPIDHQEWIRTYESGPYPVTTDDLVIGFELPPCAKRSLPRWVDVRVHPLRFLGVRGHAGWDLFGIRSNIAGIEEAAARVAVNVPRPNFKAVRALRDAAVFTCQVHNDASMIRDGRLLTPADVWPQLIRWASRFGRVVVCPHPAEPEGPWPTILLRDLPHAQRAEVSTYQALASVEEMCTVSSSTGIEAPYFGCRPTFLYRPPDAPPPIRLATPELWREIAAAVTREQPPTPRAECHDP